MSIFNKRNNPVQNESGVEAEKIVLIEILAAEETEQYLILECKALLTGFIFTTNLQQSDLPFAPINKFIDAIIPKAEHIDDLIGAQVAAVFKINQQRNYTYYNLTDAFPMETALVELLADFEQSTDSVEEEAFEDEFEEEVQSTRQSKLASTLQSNTTGKLEKRLPGKLGSKTGERKAVIGPRANRQNRPPVNNDVKKMLGEDDE